MMMPNPTIQRDFAAARRSQRSATARRSADAGTHGPTGRTSRSAIRVQLGHWLIGAGARLSGERVERVRRYAPQRAA